MTSEQTQRVTPGCRDCRAGLEHCHGTRIHHWLHRPECTDADCPGPDLLHTFVVDCGSVGCECARVDATVLAG